MNPSEVDSEVLTSEAEQQQQQQAYGGSSAAADDTRSIMGFWLPAGVMRSGREVMGAADITADDRSLCQLMYPR